MKAFTNKKEFYNSIWTDYLEHRKKVARGKIDKEMMQMCFIYPHILEKKEVKSSVLAADREAFDKYLDDYLYNMEMRRIRNDEKASKEKYKLKTIPRFDKFTLLCAAKKVCGDDKERFGEILKAVTMSKHKNAKSIDPFKAYEEYVYSFICSAILEFFRKNGYELPNDNKPGKTAKNVEKKQKTDDNYIDEIELMYKYLDYLNAEEELSVKGGGVQITNEYIQSCEVLYQRLSENVDEPEDIFLPLYIDPISGAGVCIIRTTYSETKEKISGVFVLTFGGCCYDKTFNMDYDGYEEISYNMTAFRSVTEAFNEFKRNLGGDEYFYEYNNYNSAILKNIPEGEIDKRLMPLIFSDEDRETLRKKRDDEIKAMQKAKESERLNEYINPRIPAQNSE